MTRLDAPPEAPELSTDEAKRLVLDELKRICPQGAVAFSGGEFLLRPDCLELLEHNARNGLYSFINTSSVGVNADLVQEVKEITQGNVTFGFSLDSVDPDLQAKCRSGSTELLEEKMRICDENGVGYFVLVTVSKLNVDTIGSTLGYLRDREIPTLRSPFVPRGAAGRASHLLFTSDDMEQKIHPALRAHSLCYVSHTPFFADPNIAKIGMAGRQLALGNMGCQAGRGFIGVSAEGDVAPCVHLLDSEVLCGNVRDRALSHIFENSPILKGLREGGVLKGKCAVCRYGDSCRGCRSLAYYHTGDYLASDPTCFFTPAEPEERSPHEEEQTRRSHDFLLYLSRTEPWSRIFGRWGRFGVPLKKFFHRLRAGVRGKLS